MGIFDRNCGHEFKSTMYNIDAINWCQFAQKNHKNYAIINIAKHV